MVQTQAKGLNMGAVLALALLIVTALGASAISTVQTASASSTETKGNTNTSPIQGSQVATTRIGCGIGWQLPPTSDVYTGMLRSVAAIAPNDVWAVGYSLDDGV